MHCLLCSAPWLMLAPDCGSTMLSAGIVTATSADEACKDVDIAVMVRRKAQGQGWG